MNPHKYWLGQVGDFEVKQLRVFTTVVQCGGFSAAEAELNITRSTISIHISNLEARLNLKLCQRGRAGFALTEEGKIVYESARKLFGSLEEFRATVNNLTASLSGDLRLVFSDTVSGDPRLGLPELIHQVNERAPDVYITVDVAALSEIEQMVINEEAEVGFIPIHHRIEALDYLHLFTDTCRLYCHRSHPLFDRPDSEISDELIDSYPFVQAGVKPHRDASKLIEQMAHRATAYYYETRLALIRSGRYTGFLPEYFVANATQPGELRALKPEQHTYTLDLGVIVRKSARPNKARDLFMSLLKSTRHKTAGDA